jgi:hypothetical protein
LGLVITADHMANYVQRGNPLDQYDIARNPGLSVLSQKWSNERIAWFSGRVPTLERFTIALHTDNGHGTSRECRVG